MNNIGPAPKVSDESSPLLKAAFTLVAPMFPLAPFEFEEEADCIILLLSCSPFLAVIGNCLQLGRRMLRVPENTNWAIF